MIESMVWVVGAFLLYLVVFPLVGALVGFMMISLMPYLAGAGLIWCVMNLLGYGAATFWMWMFGSLWAVTVFVARKRLISAGTSLRWHEGHYKAACTTLAFKRMTAKS
jgi:hypothetical protein